MYSTGPDILLEVEVDFQTEAEEAVPAAVEVSHPEVEAEVSVTEVTLI